MKLFYTPGVCSLAPHILLREADAEFSLDRVSDAKRTEDGRDYLGINPNGYVPALEIAADQVLTEGPAIMQFIADRFPSARLAPENGTYARYVFQGWLNFITAELHKSFTPLFNPGMPAEAKAVYKDLIAQRLDVVAKTLAAQDYLLADGYSAADVYLFVVTGWCGFVDIDLSRWQAITAHRERIAARPAVQAALHAEGLK